MHSATARATPVLPKTMTIGPPPGWFYAASIVVLSAWILRSFLQAMLAAGVTAIASWQLYTRLAACLPWNWRIGAVFGVLFIAVMLITAVPWLALIQ